MPDYRAHLSRHGHNLSHDFSFTSACGHLLTVFAQHMNPEEHIKGHIEMFTRTQPLNGCPNADIEEFIDYFFVPYDMFWMGFGDNFFQTNEPFSTAITINDGSLPLFDFKKIADSLELGSTNYPLKYSGLSSNEDPHILLGQLDSYSLDCEFMSIYRNMFHNFINPNVLFYPVAVNMVGSPTPLINYQIPADFFQPNVFPAVLAAYNCVYEHFYRLDDREAFDASIYNLDKTLLDGDTPNDVWSHKFFSLKYRPRHFDYFTAGSVAPLINPLNLQGGSSNQSLMTIRNYLSASGIFSQPVNADSSSQVVTNLSGVVGSVSPRTPGNYVNQVINSASLRSMFAVEKLLSVTNRAKKTYDAQVMAHFGVKVPKDVKHQIQFLGQQKGSIHIGEIISTADTVSGDSGTSLGDIAGKGYGNLGIKDIDFTAPCHGIVIGIYSCVPKVRYYVGTVKEWCLTNRLDFYNPEFEHLGMQPIFRWECSQIPVSFNYQVGLLYTGSTKPVGWQMRYEQYKKQISRVSPAFAKTLLSNGPSFQSDSGMGAELNFNNWSNWLIAQRPFEPRINAIMDTSNTLQLQDYLCPPALLNDLFVYTYPDTRFQKNTNVDSGTGGYFDLNTDVYSLDVYDTPKSERDSFAWNMASLFYFDPLLHFADVKMKLISTMSDNTLPELAAV